MHHASKVCTYLLYNLLLVIGYPLELVLLVEQCTSRTKKACGLHLKKPFYFIKKLKKCYRDLK